MFSHFSFLVVYEYLKSRVLLSWMDRSDLCTTNQMFVYIKIVYVMCAVPIPFHFILWAFFFFSSLFLLLLRLLFLWLHLVCIVLHHTVWCLWRARKCNSLSVRFCLVVILLLNARGKRPIQQVNSYMRCTIAAMVPIRCIISLTVLCCICLYL